jgi:hypothetical protein
MFHLGMWRERLRNAFVDVSESRPFTPIPTNIDEVNDAELANGIGAPLADAAARADHLLGELIDLYTKLGDRPFDWGLAKTTTEAVLRNSFTHARIHIAEYMNENGDVDGGDRVTEDAVDVLRKAAAPALALGAVLYNLACVRARQQSSDDAIDLLREGLALRPDMKTAARDDKDLAPLVDDPRFQRLVES